LVGRLDESDLYRHADGDAPGIAFNDVGEHAYTFFQLHQDQDVSNIYGESRRSVLIGHRKCLDFVLTSGGDPLNVIGPTVGADAPRIELVLPATVTLLNQ